MWERLFRRAGVALSMTEGFHPKPRISFPSALAVGIAGLDELVEVDLAEPHTTESLRTAIEPQLPTGMYVGAIDFLPSPAGKAQVFRVTFEIQIPSERQAALAKQIEWLLVQASLPIQREGRAAPLDLRPLIAELGIVEGALQIRLQVDREGSARPREVLHSLEIADLESQGFYLIRTRVEVA